MYTDYNYTVETADFADRHFIKGFSKKYTKAWEITYTAITAELARIDRTIAETDRAVTVHIKDGCKIAKLYFRVAGTRQSAKGSGNRLIVFIDENQHLCTVLLVYSKNDIGPPGETQKWETQVKTNYPQYWARIVS